MAAPLPDHYRTLGVAPSSGAEAIKTAYRALARRFHPDAAPGNPHATAQFQAVQEAYAVLSHPARRRRYDEARWLSGLPGGGKVEAISGATLLRDARRLQQQVEAVGRSRTHPAAVQRVALFLLRDEHLAVLQAEGDTSLNMQLAAALLHACTGLKAPVFEPVLRQLRRLQPVGPELAPTLAAAWQRQKAADRETAWRPLWIVLMTVVLCALLWRLAHR